MNGVVTTCAGSFGRFGNALFQYCVARAYAESIGAELHVGPWVGREIFEGVQEPMMRESLPVLKDEKLDGSTNVHLHGYFQRPEHVALLSRKKVKEWLKPRKPWSDIAGHALACHKRRGDYLEAGYAVVTDASYDKAMREAGYDPAQAKVFSDEDPGNIFDDFFGLAHSKVIFRANSSFSWWACTLSDAEVYSPVVEDSSGWTDCTFVKGNHSRMHYLFGNIYIGE